MFVSMHSYFSNFLKFVVITFWSLHLSLNVHCKIDCNKDSYHVNGRIFTICEIRESNQILTRQNLNQNRTLTGSFALIKRYFTKKLYVIDSLIFHTQLVLFLLDDKAVEKAASLPYPRNLWNCWCSSKQKRP